MSIFTNKAKISTALTNKAKNATVSAKNTGLKSPTATGVALNNWTNPENAYASDNVYATEDSYPNFGFQDYYNFDLGVPAGATIVGIEVKFEGYIDTDGIALVYLSWDGVNFSGTCYKATALTTSNSIVTLGGSTDLWERVWTADEFSNANFQAIVRQFSGDGDITYLDHIQVKVYYTTSFTNKEKDSTSLTNKAKVSTTLTNKAKVSTSFTNKAKI